VAAFTDARTIQGIEFTFDVYTKQQKNGGVDMIGPALTRLVDIFGLL
jgi:hypothetical protein